MIKQIIEKTHNILVLGLMEEGFYVVRYPKEKGRVADLYQLIEIDTRERTEKMISKRFLETLQKKLPFPVDIELVNTLTVDALHPDYGWCENSDKYVDEVLAIGEAVGLDFWSIQSYWGKILGLINDKDIFTYETRGKRRVFLKSKAIRILTKEHGFDLGISKTHKVERKQIRGVYFEIIDSGNNSRNK